MICQNEKKYICIGPVHTIFSERKKGDFCNSEVFKVNTSFGDIKETFCGAKCHHHKMWEESYSNKLEENKKETMAAIVLYLHICMHVYI